MKKAIITGIVVLLLAGVAYGAYTYYSVQSSPERELLMAEKNVRELDSYTVEVGVDMEVQTPDDEASTLLTVVANYDRVAEALYAEGFLEIVSQGMILDMGMNVTYVDDTLYARINNIPSYLSMFLPTEINNLIGEDVLLVSNLTETIDLLLAEFLEENDMPTMSTEEILQEMEKISEDVWRKGVIKVTNTEEDELDGEKAKKFTLAVDADKMIDFYEKMIEEHDLIDFASDATGEDPDVIREEMDLAMEEAREEMKGAYENMELYAWVVNDYLVRVETSSLTDLSEEGSEEEAYTKTTTKISYTNFNESFDIAAPEDYVTIDQFIENIENLLDSFLGSQMSS